MLGNLLRHEMPEEMIFGPGDIPGAFKTLIAPLEICSPPVFGGWPPADIAP